MDLIDKFGHNLTNVRINMREVDGFKVNNDAASTSNGYYMDHVLQKCPLLNTLRLKDTYLLCCDPNLQTVKSLKELTMVYAFINPNFLTKLSRYCSYIGEFNLFRPLFVNPDGDVLYSEANIIINMPDTSISTIEWEDADFFHNSSAPKFYLKLTTENNYYTKFFVGSIDYEDSMKTD